MQICKHWHGCRNKRYVYTFLQARCYLVVKCDDGEDSMDSSWVLHNDKPVLWVIKRIGLSRVLTHLTSYHSPLLVNYWLCKIKSVEQVVYY